MSWGCSSCAACECGRAGFLQPTPQVVFSWCSRAFAPWLGLLCIFRLLHVSCMRAPATHRFNAMASLFASLNTFPAEAAIVNRERAGKSYHVLPYYLARLICDMPLRVGQGLLFGVIVYCIVGLNPAAAAFFQFVALTILEGLASQALGVAVSAAVRGSDKLAFAVAPGITVILMLFGGFFVATDSIPAAIRWICYLSHLYYAFQGLVINNFAGRTGWSCASAQDPACTITGDQIISRLGFGDKPRWEAYVGLSGLILGCNGRLRRAAVQQTEVPAAVVHHGEEARLRDDAQRSAWQSQVEVW
ncbi:hypothetical protein ABPG77_009044 [Micractinium sp. CCAP 211/92]